MGYNVDVFQKQYWIINKFLHHLAYYRACHSVYGRLNVQSPFWCATIDAHLMIAALYWCKVFGSDGCNITHWKNTPKIDIERAHTSFKSSVMSRVGFSSAEWSDYHNAMLKFRNKYVAHHDNYSQPVPDFDIARDVAFAYDVWVRVLIRPDFYDGPLLSDDYPIWLKNAFLIAEKAIVTDL